MSDTDLSDTELTEAEWTEEIEMALKSPAEIRGEFDLNDLPGPKEQFGGDGEEGR